MKLTWAQFKAKVRTFLTVDSDRLGAQDFVDGLILVAVGKLQDLIDYYRVGHESTWEFDDGTKDGFTTRIDLPQGAYILGVFHRKTGVPCREREAFWYPHSRRNELICNAVAPNPRFRFTVDPQASTLWMFPGLAPGYAIRVEWQGVRDSFADTDAVPFDDEAALVVAFFVKAHLKLEVEDAIGISATYERKFRDGLVALRSKLRARLLGINRPELEPLPDCHCVSSCLCAKPSVSSSGALSSRDSTRFEWAMFGDSGDQTTIRDTDAVATAVRAWNPGTIIHLGDANYPAGSSVTLTDNFRRHFWSWIHGKSIFASYGNHDLMSDYGAPLTGILTAQQAAIGAPSIADRKLWFSITRGPVQFFVLNSGIDDADPDAQASAQYEWLRAALAASTSTWKIVVLHRAPYTSDSTHGPGTTLYRWPFRAMGADVVVSAHAHTYERLLVDDLPYIVCGLGGAPRYAFRNPVLPQSQFRWAGDVGFLRCFADSHVLQFSLVNARSDEVIDRLTLIDDSTSPVSLDEVGDNYQIKGGILQVFNGSTGWFGTVRIVGDALSPSTSIDPEGTLAQPVNFRWATATCLQLWNATSSTWHPIHIVGSLGQQVLAIGPSGAVYDNAKIESFSLKLLNTTTGSYRPIYLYGTPPAIAIS